MTTEKCGLNHSVHEEEALMLLDKSRFKDFNVVDLESGGGNIPLQGANMCRLNGALAEKSFRAANDAGLRICPEPCKPDRLVSLDVFRGMTVAAMILVDFGGGLWPAINHSPWDGITFADFVVPAFLFIVGVSLSLTHKATEDKHKSSVKIFRRTLKIFVLGLILQGGYIHGVKDLSYGIDLQFFRVMGVLQRIAIAYVVVAILEVYTTNRHMADANENFFGIVKLYHWQWIAGTVLIFVYLALLYGLYVPDWHFELLGANNSQVLEVKCNVRGSMSPACNAVGYVDRLLLGISHLYKRPAYRRTQVCSVDSPLPNVLPGNVPTWCLAPFDPEGLLSSIPAILTCLIGAHHGHVLLHMKGYKRQLCHWLSSGFVIMILGFLLEVAGMPLNKQLYSMSYTFVTGGVVALAFSATFVLVDAYKWRSSTAFLKWIGVHSLMIYALLASGVLPVILQGFYWQSPENNLIQILLGSLGF